MTIQIIIVLSFNYLIYIPSVCKLCMTVFVNFNITVKYVSRNKTNLIWNLTSKTH